MKQKFPCTYKAVDHLLNYLSQHFHPQSDQFFHVINIQNYNDSVCEWWYQLKLSVRVSLLKRLEHEGYVQHYFIQARNVGYQVTPRGVAFVQSGAYSTRRKLEKKSRRHKRLYKITALLLAILAGILLGIWIR